MHRAAYHFIKALSIPLSMTTKSRLHTAEKGQDVDEEDINNIDNISDNIHNIDNIDVSFEIDAAADDVEAMGSTMIVNFDPGDVLGKLLAFVNQVHMSTEGVREYLKHACVVHQLKPMQLRLWVRTRWGSMSNCLELMLAIQKICILL